LAGYNGAVGTISPSNLTGLVVAAVVSALLLAAVAAAPGGAFSVHDGPELDYQPAVVRMKSSDRLLLVFERLDPSTLSGDLYQVASDDEGASWSAPEPAIASVHNERHPALVELADGTLLLFYLSDVDEAGEYRINRAVSADGESWQAGDVLDLGWPSAGEINPSVVHEPDGTLTMVYQRLGGPSFVAQSTDSGATWDHGRVQVSAGSSALPRIARRESDGLYVATYQTNPGNNSLNLWAKTTYDASDWSGAPIAVSVGLNTHDSTPLFLPDGQLLVYYARQVDSAFDIFYRSSGDDFEWSREVRVTDNPNGFDTQPHPLLLPGGQDISLFWPRQDTDTAAPYQDHDVWTIPEIPVAQPVALYMPLAYHY
jgi:hypothetical protein